VSPELDAGVLPDEFRGDVRGMVRGSVVEDEDAEVRQRLGQQALNALTQVVPVFVAGNDHVYTTHHCLRLAGDRSRESGRAGFPRTVVSSDTSRTTTAPIPTSACRPTRSCCLMTA